MWIVLVFAGFVVIGLGPSRTTRVDTGLAAGLVVVVLSYIALSRHLL